MDIGKIHKLITDEDLKNIDIPFLDPESLKMLIAILKAYETGYEKGYDEGINYQYEGGN